MKRLMYCLLLLSSLISSCNHSVDALTAFSVAGTYQLIWYSNATLSDDSPSGTIQASEVDGEHINLMIMGRSAKTKISYAYTNVLVTSNPSSNSMLYNLIYKNRTIGTARVDGVSRYIVLNPSSSLHIEGLDI